MLLILHLPFFLLLLLRLRTNSTEQKPVTCGETFTNDVTEKVVSTVNVQRILKTKQEAWVIGDGGLRTNGPYLKEHTRIATSTWEEDLYCASLRGYKPKQRGANKTTNIQSLPSTKCQGMCGATPPSFFNCKEGKS